MRVWTFIKLSAALVVALVISCTGLLTYHVLVKPLGGVFEDWVPSPAAVVGVQADAEFVKMLDSAELPDIDPGEKVFQKALELIALGRLEEAREKLNTIVNIFPTSASAPEARRIVGQINLDEILSTTVMTGKKVHTVGRGESYLAIASRYQTTLDHLLHINGMQELGRIQPGDELVVMPLNFRLRVDPAHGTLSVWDGGRFVCEYPIRHLSVAGGRLPAQSMEILSKSGQLDGRRRGAAAPKAGAAEAPAKSIQLSKHSMRIAAYVEGLGSVRGIFLDPADFEELFLLTRVGNVVEIRQSGH